ncbi:MAG: hypothetical protein HGB26_05895 [Desulfobulbaceae bacterium]|nr:hypothetical protein [Desulfobulbaceae bacterium]
MGIIVDLDEHPRLNSSFDIGAYQFSRFGDIDHDGIVGLKDLLLGLHILAGIPIGVPVYADSDTDGDMKIGLPEVIYALQRVAGLR